MWLNVLDTIRNILFIVRLASYISMNDTVSCVILVGS